MPIAETLLKGIRTGQGLVPRPPEKSRRAASACPIPAIFLRYQPAHRPAARGRGRFRKQFRESPSPCPTACCPPSRSTPISGEPDARLPALDERFLPPRDFVWGSFTASDGAVLRWGHLPVPESIPRGARRLRHRGRVRRVHREAFRDDARSGGARHRRVVPRLARPGTVDPAVAVSDPAARPQFQSRRRGPRRVHAGISAARSAAAPGGAFDGRRDRAGLPAPPSRTCSPARRCPRQWSGCASDACRRRWCAC